MIKCCFSLHLASYTVAVGATCTHDKVARMIGDLADSDISESHAQEWASATSYTGSSSSPVLECQDTTAFCAACDQISALVTRKCVKYLAPIAPNGGGKFFFCIPRGNE